MRMRVITMDFKANVKTWLRSKGTLFWTLAFPIMLILIFGMIFSGIGEVEYSLHVQDLDDSSMSVLFNTTLNSTGVLDIIPVNKTVNITSYIQENNIKRLLVIPNNFGQIIQQSYADPSASVRLTFYLDPSEQSANQVVQSIVSSVVQTMNMNLSQGRNIITINQESTISEEFTFIDYFLPGMIGFTIMQTCIYGSIERNTKYRKDGILRKLLTTPITRSEWIFSKMLFMLFLSFGSFSVLFWRRR